MEKIHLEYPAQQPAQASALRRTHVGVVGSGDLEVLAESVAGNQTVIDIRTSVDGSGPVWRAQMDRMIAAGRQPAVRLEINDFGATPGVVQMRIAQALEEIGHE